MFAVDGNANTRWTTETPQRFGQWFQLDLGDIQTVGSVTLDSSGSLNDEPAHFTVATSTNGSIFSATTSGSGSSNGITTIDFSDRSARYIRITQTGNKSFHWWSIHEISVSESSSDKTESNDALSRTDWLMTAANNSNQTRHAIDGIATTRWTTSEPQHNNQWIEIDLGNKETFNQIVLDSEGSPMDFPREYLITAQNGIPSDKAWALTVLPLLALTKYQHAMFVLSKKVTPTFTGGQFTK